MYIYIYIKEGKEEVPQNYYLSSSFIYFPQHDTLLSCKTETKQHLIYTIPFMKY